MFRHMLNIFCLRGFFALRLNGCWRFFCYPADIIKFRALPCAQKVGRCGNRHQKILRRVYDGCRDACLDGKGKECRIYIWTLWQTK